MGQAKREFRDYETTGYGDFGGGVRVDGTVVIDSNGKIIESAGIQIADGDTFDDTNGNEVLGFGVVASAVNYAKITNAATGNQAIIEATGDDTDVGLRLAYKGTNPALANVTVYQDDAGSQGAQLVLFHDSVSPADADTAGAVNFVANDDGGNFTQFAIIEVACEDVTDGTEDGNMVFKAQVGGSNTEFLSFNEVAPGYGDIVQVKRPHATPSTQSLSGPGAVNVTTSITEFTSTGTGDALTLADGVEGQHKYIVYIAEGAGGDTGVLTPSNLAGANTTITFTDLGDSAHLLFTAGAWYFLGGEAVVA